MSNLVMENDSMNDQKHPELSKSDIIKHLPKACGDEKAAVEFFERQRWGKRTEGKRLTYDLMYAECKSQVIHVFYIFPQTTEDPILQT